MIIYKFGGASVKDAEGVKNLKRILLSRNEAHVVVLSAFGKTTNRLENVVEEAMKKTGKYEPLLASISEDHLSIVQHLFNDANHYIAGEIEELVHAIETLIKKNLQSDYNFLYDQVIVTGELLSTKIVSAFLNHQGIENRWIDARLVIKTDDNYRDANVLNELSGARCRDVFNFSETDCYVTQGFIGADPAEHSTSLGREGSDFSAALIASFLEAKSVTLWKDVSGIFNADPAVFENVQQIPSMKYPEVIELTYYGAKVIHPKTIKPLYEKDIPLYVKSFNDPGAKGTLVSSNDSQSMGIPFIINKEKQVLISISNKDLSFFSEINVSDLFGMLNEFRLKANLMQHSAISFSVCVDTPMGREVTDLIAALRKTFKVLYNDGLQLITIRNYSDDVIERFTKGKKVLVEQRSRHTVQFVLE